MTTERPTATAAARAEAAAAIRRLTHAFVGHAADPQLLALIADRCGELATATERGTVRIRSIDDLRRDVLGEPVADGAAVDHYADCPVSGAANPLSAQIRAWRDGDAVRAEVVLGPAFEGAPGRAHGGAVAAVLDDVLGFLSSIHSVVVYAGELTVRYLRPTPLNEPLEVRGWVESREGRRLVVAARCTHEGEVLAEARSIRVVQGA